MKKTTKMLSIFLAACMVMSFNSFAGEAAPGGEGAPAAADSQAVEQGDSEGMPMPDDMTPPGDSEGGSEGDMMPPGDSEGGSNGDMTPPGGIIKDAPPEIEAMVETAGNENKELTMTPSTYASNNTFTGRDDTGFIYIGYDIVDGALTDQSNWTTEDTKNITLNKQVTGAAFTAVRLSGEESDVNITGNLMLTDAQSDNDGTHASDFSGVGAAISAVNGADIKAEDLNIVTFGLVRAGLILDNYCTAWLKNCSIITFGNNPFEKAWDGYENSANTGIMLSPPWVLGIQGGVRTINVLDASCTLVIEDSYLSSGGWAVISTDGCSDPYIYVVDSTLEIMADNYGMDDGSELFGYEDGKYGSGYGSYIIGGAQEYVYGSEINGATYAAIAREGSIEYRSSEGTIDITSALGDDMGTIEGAGNASKINTVYGFMTHAASDVWVTVTDGTEVNTAEATFLYRDTGHAYFTADNAVLNPENGIILQMMDTDDSTVGGFNPFNEFLYEDAGMPSESGNITGEMENNETVIMTLANGSYEGDLFNGTGYYTQAGDVLTLTIGEGAELTGDVVLTETCHGIEYSPEAIEALKGYGEDTAYVLMDADYNVTEDEAEAAYIQFTQFSVRQYFMLCHVINKEYYNGQSAINVYVQDGGVWKVEDESLITYLNIEDGTVYGELIENEDGSLTIIPGENIIEAGEYGTYVEANVAESTGMGMVGGGDSAGGESAEGESAEGESPAGDSAEGQAPAGESAEGESPAGDSAGSEAAAPAETQAAENGITWDSYIEFLWTCFQDTAPDPSSLRGLLDSTANWASIEAAIEDGPWYKFFGEKYYDASTWEEFVAAGGVGTFNADFEDSAEIGEQHEAELAAAKEAAGK